MIGRIDLASIMPEILLLFGTTGLLLVRPPRRAAGILSLTTVVLSFWATLPQWIGTRALFGGTYVTGPFPAAFKAAALLGTAVAIVIVFLDKRLQEHIPEANALILFTACGALLLISARNFLLAYLAFEMLSVSSYALVGSRPGEIKSAEAGLKYAVFGGAASAFLLYGISLLYGMTGTLQYGLVGPVLSSGAGIVAVLFVFVGVMYKLAAAPFHYWSPDAFEGAAPSIAGYLSVVPKIAGFAFLIFLLDFLGDSRAFLALLTASAFLSMTYGNLAAIAQKNVPRLLAYSSIAHAGYILVAAGTLGTSGRFAVFFYLAAYLFMNLGAFLVTTVVAPTGAISEFRALSRRNAFLAFAMAVFLFSLTGLPPFGGFVGKLFILSAAIDRGAWFLIAALVVNTVISLYYYARILKEMYLEDGDETPFPASATARFCVGALTAGVFLLGIAWSPVAALLQRIT
ncbi:MAG: NADH-quinone oxidoreductase subunit N [Candidatus Hydrogenedentota bacterium]|nr:MAG: NADH-quinone oxidoreductase subunit N [Candidatus Hydrogenedentota bacterium]